MTDDLDQPFMTIQRESAGNIRPGASKAAPTRRTWTFGDGRFEGMKLEDVPSGYLLWRLRDPALIGGRSAAPGSTGNLDGEARKAIEDELRRRGEATK
jgi:hypothetical protein